MVELSDVAVEAAVQRGEVEPGHALLRGRSGPNNVTFHALFETNLLLLSFLRRHRLCCVRFDACRFSDQVDVVSMLPTAAFARARHPFTVCGFAVAS